MSDPEGDVPAATVAAARYWHVGQLPAPAQAPAPDASAWLGLVGRPEITVDGRNLADVLAPLYRALAHPDQPA
jgi:hypothetical protein